MLWQQLVLETDQEIQRQMSELEAADNALAKMPKRTKRHHTNGRRTNHVCSIFAANSIGSWELI